MIFVFFDINKRCDKCKSKMRIEYDEAYVNFHRLKCINCDCTKSILLSKGFKISDSSIQLNEYSFIIYSWLEKNYEYNMAENSNVSLIPLRVLKG